MLVCAAVLACTAALRASNGLRLVPYCLWGNREPGNEMQIWFLEK